MSASITVVLSTYNRSSALRRTLSCLVAQDLSDWTALVIGDKCSDNTSEVIEEFDDDRINFINLDKRFGEQSGPNSVGVRLAKTKYVAFLNHDDFWTNNHLSHAIASLENSDAEFYMARAIFVIGRGPNAHRPYFSEISPADRTIARAYDAPFYYFEPKSSWVATAALFERIGTFRLATETPLLPIEEFSMRLARQGVDLIFGDQVTVFKPRAALSYKEDPKWTQTLADVLARGDDALLQGQIDDDYWLTSKIGGARRYLEPKILPDAVGDRLALAAECGISLPEMEQAAKGGKRFFKSVLKRRTGEVLHSQPDLEEAIHYARQQLG